MDESFQLLSIISPRFPVNLLCRKTKKGPNVLALKKPIRRFSGHRDSVTFSKDNILVKESSSEVSSVCNNSLNLKTDVDNSIIVISDSETSCVEDSFSKLNENELLKSCNLEISKYEKVARWLLQVNKEIKKDEKNYITLSTKPYDNISKENSVEIISDSDESGNVKDSKRKSSLSEKKCIENAVLSENLKNEDKIIENNSLEDSICEKIQDINLSCERSSSSDSIKNILDNVYGENWRQNEDVILQKSEIKPKKKLVPLDNKKYQTTSKLKNKPTSLHFELTPLVPKTPKYPWMESIKRICDTSSDDDQSEKLKNVRSKLNFEECENVSTGTNKENHVQLFIGNIKKNLEKSESNEGNIADNLVKKASNEESTEKTKKIKNIRNIENEKLNSEDVKKSKKVRKKIEKRRSFYNHESKSKEETFLASLSRTYPDHLCDPTALLYRKNYKTYKVKLATKLFSIFNSKVFNDSIPHDSKIEWNDRMRGTAGFCRCFKRKSSKGIITRYVSISLATKVVDSADRLRDTLIHEMCHAASWIVNELSDGHGPIWQSWAQKAMSTFQTLPPIKRCHNYEINTKYTYKCIKCGYCIGRHSKSIDTERKKCGYCFGTFEILLNKKNKRGSIKSVPATPKKEPTGFALFVKSNYAVYKTPTLNHGDVMKVLGQKFSEMKLKKTILTDINF